MQVRGLRRLVLALCGAWAVAVVALLGYELLAHRVGYFVEMTLPVGTVVSGTHATLPDGRVIELDATIGKPTLKPWEFRWADAPVVAELHVRPTLLAVTLGVPLFAWLGIEAVAWTVGWVLRGFGKVSTR
jgi:hypothetical protein